MRNLILFLSLVLILSFSRAQNPADFAARTTLDSRYAPFYHGVASGDPTPNGVILWTRVTPAQSGAVSVNWEVATDTGMTNVVASRVATTHDSMDHTVKVDVSGLQAGTWYYYRFETNGRYSLTGRTFTAPTGDIDSLRFGVVSCSNYPSGFFNVYGQLASRDDLHAIIHLGDYIYEGGGGGNRPHDPPNEILDLEDYRMRHSQYKLDEDMRCLHQMYPFITVWDDHESSNDSWRDGAENHDPQTEGLWADRKADAIQAYHEWMPIRQPDPGNSVRIYRTVKYGDLLDLIMLDTRLIDRDEQVTGGAVSDPQRNMIGPVQLAWLTNEMTTTNARWKVLGQQVMMAPLEVLSFPVNTDQWDGYAAERERLYDSIMTKNIDNVVVLTGDIHTAWANDLPLDNYDAQTGANSVGVEFVTASVTSGNSVVSFGEQVIMLANPHIKHIDLDDHGYFILDVNKSRAQADFFIINDIANPNQYNYRHDVSWYCNDQERHLNEAQDSSSFGAWEVPDRPSKTPPNPAIGVEDPNSSAGMFALLGAYPNPFESYVFLEFYLHKASDVRIRLMDLQGKLIREKALRKYQPGLHFVPFEDLELPRGLYLFEIEAGGQKATRKVISVR